MRPHRMDGVSLSFGLIFVAIAGWWLISRLVTVALPNAGWLVAGALIVFGIAGLLGAIRSGHRAEAVEPVEPPAEVEPRLHAEIVQELLDDPATRFRREQG
jgi:hypothetical protein